MANRNKETIKKHYSKLIPEIESHNPDETLYIVGDDGFAHDAQVWTERDKEEILRGYAKSAASVVGGGTEAEEFERLEASFSASAEIFEITPREMR